MDTFEMLDGLAAKLLAAGVPATTDSGAQYPSLTGYVLVPPPTLLVPGTVCDWLMSGDLWAVAGGPWNTAAWHALDSVVTGVLGVLGDLVSSISYTPEWVQLQAAGIDQPAALLTYERLPIDL